MKLRLSASRSAFTLLELLAAVTILGLLMTMIFTIFNQASRAWLLGESRTETFQAARLVLENISRELESAVAGTNAVSGKNIFLKDFAQSSGYSLPNPNGLVLTAPNDTFFFVANNSESSAQGFCDLTEYGYIPVFAQTDSYSMHAGNYYLLRHQVFNADTNGTANVFWDFLDPLHLTDWWNTPQTSPSTKTPILENVIRFIAEFEYVNTSVSTTVTFLSPSWPPSGVAGLDGQLPRAVHLRISVLDRRLAARLSAACNGAPLSAGDLGNIPYNLNGTWANPAAQSICREGLRTFYRSVYPQNASN